MSELDLEHLLGGYATNTLTEAEHQALFRAAMVDQRLFDLLADEQALKELLDDPTVRRRLLVKLKEPHRREVTSWYSRTWAWIIRPETLTVAGSVAALAVATVLGLHLYEGGRQIIREEESRPPLSQIIAEPTVRSKLRAKPAAPSPGTEAPPGKEPQDRPASAPPLPEPPTKPAPQEGKSEETAGLLGKSATELRSAAPTRDEIRHAPTPARRERRQEAQGDHVEDERHAAETPEIIEEPAQESAAAPPQLPPVILPRVPGTLAKGKSSEVDKPRSAESGEPPIGSSRDSSLQIDTTPAASPSPNAEPPAEAEGTREAEAHQAQQASPLQNEPVRPGPFSDNLRAPAIGNARALFLEQPETKTAGLPIQPRKERSQGDAPGQAERQQILEALSPRPQEEGASQQPPAADGDLAAGQSAQETPLAFRFHRRQLLLQGSGLGEPSDLLAIPQLTIEVNQSGYLYVIARDADGRWTVLAPAGKGPGFTTVAAKPGTPYRVLLVGEADETASRLAYVVFSRFPESILEQAIDSTSSATEVEHTLAPWIKNFGPQSLKTEQVTEPLSGGKSERTTYVADAGQPPKVTLLYRLRTIP